MTTDTFTDLKTYYPEEAESLLLQSYSILKENYGEKNKRTKEALIRLIGHYEACDKPDEASKYRALLKKLEPTRK